MATDTYEPAIYAHRTWLGLIQPVGLVVAPPALARAAVLPDTHPLPLQAAFRALLVSPDPAAVAATTAAHQGELPDLVMPDFPTFAAEFLEWDPDDLVNLNDLSAPETAPHANLVHPLPDYQDTLRADYAVIDPFAPEPTAATPTDAPTPPLLLITSHPLGTDFDAPPTALDHKAHGWHASPHARLERLLRETHTPAGLLVSPEAIRLLYAPRGESSGHLTFRVADMATLPGRPLLAAFHMLLSAHRLFDAADKTRLLDLLAESRRYQAEVSTALSEQVLSALWHLLSGFQAADAALGPSLSSTDTRHQALIARIASQDSDGDSDHAYGGLLTTIMRLVFVLYAEDQGLLADHPVFSAHYSISGLYTRLRDDAALYPDTMPQRYGAWATLIATFRLIHDGGGHGGFSLSAHHGDLFDPDRYPFLEGRPRHTARNLAAPLELPRVSDGTVFEVLKLLLILGGERLSYRGLDVEQIGSVYEAMMGFRVESAHGPSLAVSPKDVVIDLAAVLACAPAKRAAFIKDTAELKLTGKAADDLKSATSADDISAALGRRVSSRTPSILPPGSLYLQPTEERRRSGSHYTPRELTAPIVKTTLAPILKALGKAPRPSQILDLKICDPAMGSGAFLVETCRQLAEHLVDAWNIHKMTPNLPPDEDALLHARRLIAQKCLFGVDKNPFAVHLAKMSLWLVTLAKNHAFTFLDHALRSGDSLIGLTMAQTAAFDWTVTTKDRYANMPLLQNMPEMLQEVQGWRDEIQRAAEGDYDQRRHALNRAEDALMDTVLVADACIAAFFARDKDKDRALCRDALRDKVRIWRHQGDTADGREARDLLREAVDDMRSGDRPITPFHWELEFPEVFSRQNPGFDAFVGNPPFMGKNTIASAYPGAIFDWLKVTHEGAHGNSDIVAHFFRRTFSLLREKATLGLIATNTISQGDTRASGLTWLCTHGGTIYAARRRVKWPGLAAVIVSVVHLSKSAVAEEALLDEISVPTITAFLFHSGGHTDPAKMAANNGLSFVGAYVLGMGFTFDDGKDDATSLDEMRYLLAKEPRNAERIRPYMGGDEVNSSPAHAHHRYVIYFGEMTEDEARRWPDLIAIVETKVRPKRLTQGSIVNPARWWMFARSAADMFSAITGLHRALTIARVGQHCAFAFLPTNTVFSEQLVVFPLETHASFAALQSRPHELWARFFGSSLEDRLRYTPSDCFETFPFPDNWQDDPTLEAAGEAYYTFRAQLMVDHDEGMTKTYNRFHDPEETSPAILHLRTLHAAMDAAVLEAYGWNDIDTTCDFFLDYEIDEETWGQKKKPYRYRWPDAIHDEVLARLLALNATRAEQESITAAKATRTPTKKAPTKSPKTAGTKAPPKPGSLL